MHQIMHLVGMFFGGVVSFCIAVPNVFSKTLAHWNGGEARWGNMDETYLPIEFVSLPVEVTVSLIFAII